jgi:hypothetical protein
MSSSWQARINFLTVFASFSADHMKRLADLSFAAENK